MTRWQHQDIECAVEAADGPKIAEILGFEEPLIPVAPSVRPMWGWSAPREHLAMRATGDGSARLLVIEAPDRSELRAVATECYRHNPTSPLLIVWVSPAEVTFASPGDSAIGDRCLVRSMSVDRARPDPVGITQIRELSIAAIAAPDLRDSARAVARHFADALDQEGLAREFFAGFKQAVDQLVTNMQNGPEDDRGRHDIALTTMLRLVFLYLLQRKGALDADPWFVMRRVRETSAEGGDIYSDCLRPLFFGLLNTPLPDRDGAARRLGDVPFLNGGLFEPLPVEQAHAELRWPDSVWRCVFDELLERFHFTAREHSDETTRSVDPEMLGKVFEGLMFGDERANSGSFYTPRPVVRDIVDDALTTWLSEVADVGRDRVLAIGGGGLPTPDERVRLLRAVSRVRVLDPAVGTGAFLLEALRALTSWREKLTGEPVDYASMRSVIHTSLYGVDLQPTATRLCALRLWLALMTTLPEGVPVGDIPPLPNLAHRVATGNALLDSSDHAAHAVNGRRFSVESKETAELRAEIAELEARFLVTHGPEKLALKRRIRRGEKRLQTALVEARLDRLDCLASPLREMAAGVDLFGERVVLDRDQAATLDALERDIVRLREQRCDIENDRGGARSFDFATRFAEAMGSGGFDIVITNPPWVRTHRIDPEERALLKARYGAAANTLWPQARSLGVRAPFGTQVDLSALFLERSLELLRPGGRLAALVPAKLLRSLHGSAVRQILAEHDIERIDDHSDARESMFDATTYPAVIIARKGQRSRRRRRSGRLPARIGVWRGDRVSRWSRPVDDIGRGHPAAPWLLVEPAIESIFERMWQNATPLGMVPDLSPTRGIFTGCNDVFLRPRGDFASMLGDAASTHVRPVLAGRDLDADGWSTSSEILWLYNDQMELLEQAPDEIDSYFEEHADRLRDRSDHVSLLPLWQVFRVKPELLGPKVVWPDIATSLRAEVVPRGVVPLNTTYVIPCETEWQAKRVAALLNSEPVRAFCWALAERARGGFRRHFAWVIRMLPVPRGFASWSPHSAQSQDWSGEVAELFGLSAADRQVLRCWREGSGESADYGAVA